MCVEIVSVCSYSIAKSPEGVDSMCKVINKPGLWTSCVDI